MNATKWIHAQKWMLRLKWSHVKANSPKLIIKYSKYSKLTVKYQTIHKVVKRIDQNINNAFLSKNNFHIAKQVFFSKKKNYYAKSKEKQGIKCGRVEFFFLKNLGQFEVNNIFKMQ